MRFEHRMLWELEWELPEQLRVPQSGCGLVAAWWVLYRFGVPHDIEDVIEWAGGLREEYSGPQNLDRGLSYAC